jgi:hypothetical protein
MMKVYPHLFISNDWIDVNDLKTFLKENGERKKLAADGKSPTS